jgi:type IV secretory pathway TraG/TraD family ATPase VirD4
MLLGETTKGSWIPDGTPLEVPFPFQHVYIIGKSGMGKSTMMTSMALDAINRGSVVFIDPHGDQAQKFLSLIPKERWVDVCYFNPADESAPYGMNPLEWVQSQHLIVSNIISVFANHWSKAFEVGARMEYIIENCLYLLVANQGQTILGISRLLIDADYRKQMLKAVKNPAVLQFWEKEFPKWTDRYFSEASGPVQNKVNKLALPDILRNIFGQSKSTFNLAWMMDNNKIFVANLSKGQLGEDNSNLLGSLLITQIQLASMARSAQEERHPAYCFIDEFQNFTNDGLPSVLSEARKYNVSMTMAHQYIGQLRENMRASVFGNVNTMVAFCIGEDDAKVVAPYFDRPTTDLINLPRFECYARLDRRISRARTHPLPSSQNIDNLIKANRERYGRPEAKAHIQRWYQS